MFMAINNCTNASRPYALQVQTMDYFRDCPTEQTVSALRFKDLLERYKRFSCEDQ